MSPEHFAAIAWRTFPGLEQATAQQPPADRLRRPEMPHTPPTDTTTPAGLLDLIERYGQTCGDIVWAGAAGTRVDDVPTAEARAAALFGQIRQRIAELTTLARQMDRRADQVEDEGWRGAMVTFAAQINELTAAPPAGSAATHAWSAPATPSPDPTRPPR